MGTTQTNLRWSNISSWLQSTLSGELIGYVFSAVIMVGVSPISADPCKSSVFREVVQLSLFVDCFANCWPSNASNSQNILLAPRPAKPTSARFFSPNQLQFSHFSDFTLEILRFAVLSVVSGGVATEFADVLRVRLACELTNLLSSRRLLR